MYRTKTSFCLFGGLGCQSHPCDVLRGMACTWVVSKTLPSSCPAPPQSSPREMFEMFSLVSDFTSQDQMLSSLFSRSCFWIQVSLLRTEDIKSERRAMTISASLIVFFIQLQKWRSWELWRMVRSLHHSSVNYQSFPSFVSSPLTSNNLFKTPIYSIRTGIFHTRFLQWSGYKLKQFYTTDFRGYGHRQNFPELWSFFSKIFCMISSSLPTQSWPNVFDSKACRWRNLTSTICRFIWAFLFLDLIPGIFYTL